MMKSIVSASLLTLAALGSPMVMAQNVAIVNGKAVPTSRLDALAKQIAQSGRPVTDDMKAQLREEIIAREIFMQEAQRKGVAGTAGYKNKMELARQSVLIGELFAEFKAKHAVTDTQAQAEYDKFAAANGGKEYKARHILVEKEDDAKAVLASLKKGEKFEELAKKLSKDPGSGANGGDLDWATAASYVTEFSEAMIKLEKGQTSEIPVKSQFGWHIIRVDDVRQAKLPAFDEVKPQIKQQMAEQQLRDYQDELRSKAKIQ